jgi:hypothetical protein
MKQLAMNYRCNFSCSDSHAGMSENNFDERVTSIVLLGKIFTKLKDYFEKYKQLVY